MPLLSQYIGGTNTQKYVASGAISLLVARGASSLGFLAGIDFINS